MNPEEKDAVDRCFQLIQKLKDVFDPKAIFPDTNDPKKPNLGKQLQEKLRDLQVRSDINHEQSIGFCAKGENLEFTIAMKTAKIRELMEGKEEGWANLARMKLKDYTKYTLTSIFTMFGSISWQYGEVLQDIARYEILDRIQTYDKSVEEIVGKSGIVQVNTVDDEASDRIVYHATKDVGEMFIAMLTTLMMVTFIVCFIRFVYFPQLAPIDNPLKELFLDFLQQQLNIGPDQVNIDFEIVAGSFFGSSEEARMHVTIRPKLFPRQWSVIFDYPSDGGQQSPKRMFKEDFEKTLPKKEVRLLQKLINDLEVQNTIQEARAAQLLQEAKKAEVDGNIKKASSKFRRNKNIQKSIEEKRQKILLLEKQKTALEDTLVNTSVVQTLQETRDALKENEINVEEVKKLLDDIQDEREKVVKVAETIGSPSADFTDVELETELQQLKDEMDAENLAKVLPIAPTTPIKNPKKKNLSLEAGWYMRQWKTRLEAGGSMEERRSFNRVLQKYK